MVFRESSSLMSGNWKIHADILQLLAAFVVEAILWSFPFAYGVFLESTYSEVVSHAI